MTVYDFIEYSDKYLKPSGSLWQYCKVYQLRTTMLILLVLMGLMVLLHLISNQKQPIRLEIIEQKKLE